MIRVAAHEVGELMDVRVLLFSISTLAADLVVGVPDESNR